MDRYNHLKPTQSITCCDIIRLVLVLFMLDLIHLNNYYNNVNAEEFEKSHVEKLVRSQIELAATSWTKPSDDMNQFEQEEQSKSIATFVSNLTASNNLNKPIQYGDMIDFHSNHNYEAIQDSQIESSTQTWPEQETSGDPMFTSSDASGDYPSLEESSLSTLSGTSSNYEIQEPPTTTTEQPRYVYRIRGPTSAPKSSISIHMATNQSRHHTVSPAIMRTLNKLDQIKSWDDKDLDEAKPSHVSIGALSPNGFMDAPEVVSLDLFKRRTQKPLVKRPTQTNRSIQQNVDRVTSLSHFHEDATASPKSTGVPKIADPTKTQKTVNRYTSFGREKAREKPKGTITSLKSQEPIKSPEPDEKSSTSAQPVVINFLNHGASQRRTTQKLNIKQTLVTTPIPVKQTTLGVANSIDSGKTDMSTVSKKPPTSTPITTIRSTPFTSTTMSLQSSRLANAFPSTLATATPLIDYPTTMGLIVRNPSKLEALADDLKAARHHHIHSHIHRINPAFMNIPYQMPMKSIRSASYETIVAASAAAAAAAATASANRHKPYRLPARSSNSGPMISEASVIQQSRPVLIGSSPVRSNLVPAKSLPKRSNNWIKSLHYLLENRLRHINLIRPIEHVLKSLKLNSSTQKSVIQSRKQLLEKLEHDSISDTPDSIRLETGNEQENVYFAEQEDDIAAPMAEWPTHHQVVRISPVGDYVASMVAHVRPPIESTTSGLNMNTSLEAQLNSHFHDYHYPMFNRSIAFEQLNQDFPHNSAVDQHNLLYPIYNNHGDMVQHQKLDLNQLNQLMSIDEVPTSFGTIHQENNKATQQQARVRPKPLVEVTSQQENTRNITKQRYKPAVLNGHNHFSQHLPMRTLANFIDDHAQFMGNDHGSDSTVIHQDLSSPKPLFQINDDSEAKVSAPHVEHADLMTPGGIEDLKPINQDNPLNDSYLPKYNHHKPNQQYRLVKEGGEINAMGSMLKSNKILSRPQINLSYQSPSAGELKAYQQQVPKDHKIQQVFYPGEIVNQAVRQAAKSVRPHLETATDLIKDQKKLLLESGHLLMNPYSDLSAQDSTKHHSKSGPVHKYIISGIVPLALLIIPVMIMIAILTQLAIMIPIVVTVVNVFVIPIIINIMRPNRNREAIDLDLKRFLYWPFLTPEDRAARSNDTTRCKRSKRSLIIANQNSNLSFPFGQDLDEYFEFLGTKF